MQMKLSNSGYKKTSPPTATSAGQNGFSVTPPEHEHDPHIAEKTSGISLGENQIVKQLTGGRVDLHASGARVQIVSPNEKRLQALGASSYTQGKQAFVGNAKDRGHEIWHLAQQTQNRVRATTSIGGHPVNLSQTLEREADAKGSLINQHSGNTPNLHASSTATPQAQSQTIQGNGISLLEDPMRKPKDVGTLINLPELLGHGWDGTAEQQEIDQMKATFRKLSAGWSSGLGEVLNTLLKKHGEKQNITQTNVAFGQLSTVKWKGVKRASKMVANPLTSRPGTTIGSDATSGVWNPYVEGHLLNHLLHGPAKYENLAPFSRSMNTTHSKNVEEPLKRMVFNEGRYFKYTVVTAPENATKTDEFIPTHIDFEVIELNTDDLAAKVGGYQYSGRIDQQGNLSHETQQNAASVPTSEVGLNTATIDDGTNALATYWNALQEPWSPAYGDVVSLLLDATYKGIKSDQHATKVDQSKRLFLPKTEIKYGPTVKLKSEVGGETKAGRSMTAFPLTLRPPKVSSGLGYGYKPETPAGWAPYVAGHLLNHHLHGPAEPENITPMTQTLNRQFEKDVEDPLKTKVMSLGYVMSLKVEMKNGDDDRHVFDSKSGFFPGILQAEYARCLPKSGVTGKELQDKKNWLKGPEKTVTLRNGDKDD
jgi:hypothetical protein